MLAFDINVKVIFLPKLNKTFYSGKSSTFPEKDGSSEIEVKLDGINSGIFV